MVELLVERIIPKSLLSHDHHGHFETILAHDIGYWKRNLGGGHRNSTSTLPQDAVKMRSEIRQAGGNQQLAPVDSVCTPLTIGASNPRCWSGLAWANVQNA
jgi:hypothetical protein